MRRLILITILAVAIPREAFAWASIYCAQNGTWTCAVATGKRTPDEATSAAAAACSAETHSACSSIGAKAFSNTCWSVATNANPTAAGILSLYKREAQGPNDKAATEAAVKDCERTGVICTPIAAACDPEPLAVTSPSSPARAPGNAPSPSIADYIVTAFPLFDIGAIRTGVSFGIGVIIALLAFAKRAALLNFIIHGNLPSKLTNYADDIEVLFKRTQRVNWYGRVVFGIVARLGMTEKQLSLVRRYWLGRVIAFDSLRRQRQNELTVLHLQLAASIKAEAKDASVRSRISAVIVTIFLVIFYLFRALFSFLFGFLFIRVTIAKLARGSLVESSDLVLLLQAKQAIEESATYLKEYLEVAETFHDQEELFGPERHLDPSVTPLRR